MCMHRGYRYILYIFESLTLTRNNEDFDISTLTDTQKKSVIGKFGIGSMRQMSRVGNEEFLVRKGENFRRKNRSWADEEFTLSTMREISSECQRFEMSKVRVCWGFSWVRTVGKILVASIEGFKNTPGNCERIRRIVVRGKPARYMGNRYRSVYVSAEIKERKTSERVHASRKNILFPDVRYLKS